MIRINNGRVSKESPPFNELYMSHQEFFEKLFAPRTTIAKDFTYVPMHAESELKAFISSMQSSFCILYGPMGVGKTTLIDHIKRDFNTTNDYYVFKYDLNRHASSLSLGEDFFHLKEDQQYERCLTLASTFVHTHLLSDIASIIGHNALGIDFYNFVLKNNSAFIIPDCIFANTKREKLELLKKFSEEKFLAYTYVALKYLSELKDIRHFTIIVDNCDLKHHLLISAFVDILCHAIKCIGSHEYVKSISCVLTCRNYTKNRLYQNRYNNALGAHGDRYVQIQKPCSLSELVEQRFKDLPHELSNLNIKYTSSTGMLWSIDKRNNLLIKLANVLKQDKLEILLVNLCNYDMSLALKCMHRIIRNREFFDPDKLIPGIIVEGDSQRQTVLTIGSFLNCLGYGNSISEKGPFYPSEETVIPNIFEWDGKNTNTFLGYIRVMLFLWNEKCIPETDGPGVHFRQLESAFNNIFSIDKDLLTSILHRMFDLGLIFAHSNTCPTKTNGNDSYILTQRAITLWNLLGSGTQLLEFYSDDTFISKDCFGPTVPLRMLPFRDRIIRVLKFIGFIADMETQNLRNLLDNSKYKFYINRFSTQLISTRCLEGVENSIETYYKPRTDIVNSKEFKVLYHNIQSKVDALELTISGGL